MAGEIRKPRRTSDDVPSPPNLIREPWRQELQDPPNLHRLTTRQTIERHGVLEIYERFAGAGAHTPVQDKTAGPVRRSRRKRVRKRDAAAKE